MAMFALTLPVIPQGTLVLSILEQSPGLEVSEGFEDGKRTQPFRSVPGIPSSRASRGPSRGFMLNLQLITSLLVLVSLARQGLLPEKQAEPLRP